MLNNENYFSVENNLRYMSVSQFKAFENCPATAYAEVTGNYEREKTTALLVGSYVDAHFEGSLDVFKAHKQPTKFCKHCLIWTIKLPKTKQALTCSAQCGKT